MFCLKTRTPFYSSCSDRPSQQHMNAASEQWCASALTSCRCSLRLKVLKEKVEVWAGGGASETHLLQLLCPPQTNKRLITIRTRTKTVITEGVDYYQNRFEEGRKQIRGCKTAENTRNKAETWSRWKRWRSNWTIRHISPEMILVRHFITTVTETWQMIRIIRRKIKNSKYF